MPQHLGAPTNAQLDHSGRRRLALAGVARRRRRRRGRWRASPCRRLLRPRRRRPAPLPEDGEARGRTSAMSSGRRTRVARPGPVDVVAAGRTRRAPSASAKVSDAADRHATARPRAAPGERDGDARCRLRLASAGAARRRSAISHGRRAPRRACLTRSATPCWRTRSWSSRYLSTVPSVASTGVARRAGSRRARPARRPSRSSRRPRAACRAQPAQRLDRRRDLAGQAVGDLRGTEAHDGDLPLEVGVLHPVVEAATLQRVVDVAGAVGGEHHDRRGAGGEGAELGHRDR